MNMAPDDFVVDAYVTVLAWKPREMNWLPALFGSTEPWGEEPRKQIVRNTSHVGKLLRITAVDLPFVAVECIASFLGKPYHDVIDTRECELKRFSDAFVRTHPDWQEALPRTKRPPANTDE